MSVPSQSCRQDILFTFYITQNYSSQTVFCFKKDWLIEIGPVECHNSVSSSIRAVKP